MGSKNVVLTGMPGAGKSVIGVLLAKALGMPFVDTDLIIQQQENRLLQDIIDKDGKEAFLMIEQRIVIGLKVEGHVVATGGSVIYSGEAVSHLKSNGIFIYLQWEFGEIEKRLRRNIGSRGIAMGRGQELFDLYIERLPLYEKYADVVLDCSGKLREDIITEIKAAWLKKSGGANP